MASEKCQIMELLTANVKSFGALDNVLNAAIKRAKWDLITRQKEGFEE